MNAATRRRIVVVTAASFVGCLRMCGEYENRRVQNSGEETPSEATTSKPRK